MRADQGFVSLIGLGLYSVPFALSLAIPGWRSLLVFSAACTGLIAFSFGHMLPRSTASRLLAPSVVSE